MLPELLRKFHAAGMRPTHSASSASEMRMLATPETVLNQSRGCATCFVMIVSGSAAACCSSHAPAAEISTGRGILAWGEEGAPRRAAHSRVVCKGRATPRPYGARSCARDRWPAPLRFQLRREPDDAADRHRERDP